MYKLMQYIISCTDNGNSSLHYWCPQCKFCRNWMNSISPQIKQFSKMFSAHRRWSRLFYGFIGLHSAFRKMLCNQKCKPTARCVVRVDWCPLEVRRQMDGGGYKGRNSLLCLMLAVDHPCAMSTSYLYSSFVIEVEEQRVSRGNTHSDHYRRFFRLLYIYTLGNPTS